MNGAPSDNSLKMAQLREKLPWDSSWLSRTQLDRWKEIKKGERILSPCYPTAAMLRIDVLAKRSLVNQILTD
ncbi:uncharacterized protein ARMOST_20648 [Armillaria ostoyae]|uniref:Uncharacterized protein n=1 Tax=Armillaria ostoyae TaxID=47428 RepID=A0A284S815_ARMOS|nr:uncharacterized protein ARMOST_20648 [Armillaria ostoyae]